MSFYGWMKTSDFYDKMTKKENVAEIRAEIKEVNILKDPHYTGRKFERENIEELFDIYRECKIIMDVDIHCEGTVWVLVIENEEKIGATFHASFIDALELFRDYLADGEI